MKSSRARAGGGACVGSLVLVCALVTGLCACTNTANAVADLPAGYWVATERMIYGVLFDLLELARLLLPL